MTTLNGTITIKGTFDTYIIEQGDLDERFPNNFFIKSVNGYSNFETNGHKSLMAAVNHVQKMIRNEYVDRCLDKPTE